MNPIYFATRTRLLFLLLFGVLVICLAACSTKSKLVGQWNKLQGVPCDWVCPGKVEFFADGTYVGALPNWNGGNYELVNRERIKLDTLTGPGVYEFEVSGDVLTFRSDENCEFRYRRAR